MTASRRLTISRHVSAAPAATRLELGVALAVTVERRARGGRVAVFVAEWARYGYLVRARGRGSRAPFNDPTAPAAPAAARFATPRTPPQPRARSRRSPPARRSCRRCPP